ncbi:MAG: transcriptional regulator NrdR [Victivallaceae bacterium]|nr:transcriptional regulator NrdR [Victivallaceae bacterium]
MRCPKCSCEDDKVIDSRSVQEGAGVRRRRECLNCRHRFTTYEGIIQAELKIIKKDNIREDFDRGKLRRGIENACYKRPIDPEVIDQMLENIYSSIPEKYDKEIPSSEIGNYVMQALKEVDHVAYVRFASVYRKFKDVEEFIEEIKALK